MPDATSVCSVEGCNGTYSTPTRLRPNTPGVGTMGICQIHARRFRNSGDVHKIRCSCNCGQLVDLYGNNETVKSYLPGHREAETKARKQARAQAVLELYEWSAEPPEITRSEATDLNYLLAQTGRRRCCTCKAIKPIEEFARRISPDKRKTNADKQRLAHIRADVGDCHGRLSRCTPCVKEQVAQWRANNTNKHTHTCVNCGTEFTRNEYVAKCCSSKCASEWGALGAGRHHQRVADERYRKCARPDCDAEFLRTDQGAHKGKWCSEKCYEIIMERATSPDRGFGPLRRAVTTRNYSALLEELRERVTVTEPLGCWTWNGKSSSRKGNNNPYPELKLGKSTVPVHRVVLEAKHGKPLGSQHAHHTCANTMCVNPDHLQPVSHRENMAEMLTRKTLTNRIRDLEAWVRERDPNADILNVIDVL